MSGAGFTVQPDVLDTYAKGLGDRADAVRAAGDRIAASNGGDINAFGVAVGQILGIPTRIALGVLRGQVAGAADAFRTDADKVRTAAASYRATDQDHANMLEVKNP
jgi:uncharacterized protein YukE